MAFMRVAMVVLFLAAVARGQTVEGKFGRGLSLHNTSAHAPTNPIYTVIPITWTNRKAGISKLKIKEMGSRYLFIILYIWLEKLFSQGDYRRRPDHLAPEQSVGSKHA